MSRNSGINFLRKGIQSTSAILFHSVCQNHHILILSCYFIIFGITSLINLSISIRDTDIFLDKLLEYFACQARGYSSSNTCDAEYEEFESYLKPELNSATYFLLGLIPWSNLLFAIQVSDIKKAVCKIIRIRSGRDTQEKTYSTSNT